MSWQHFQTYNEAPTRAFESLCNQLFELHCKREFVDNIKYFSVVNGSGGDGGVEAYTILKDETIIGLQAKWFQDSITDNQFAQIKGSIETALKIRPQIRQYIICVPRDLASNKIGRGQQVVKNPEDHRWEKLKQEISDSHPELELVLWGDYELLDLLQRSEASGIRRYWFEKSEIAIETLEYSFVKQREGWLSLKYLPELHSHGLINKAVNNFIGTQESRTEDLNEICLIKDSYANLLELIDKYERFGKLSDGLNLLIADIKSQTNYNLKQINCYIDNFLYENVNINCDLKYINFSEFLEEVDKLNSASSSYHREFKKIISDIREKNSYSNIFEKIQSEISNNLLLFIGNPGTGKTHGIANVVETILKNKNHASILIQAKSVSTNDSWKDILIKNLGLSNQWAEEEIWQGLEALSHRLECKQAIEKEDNKIPYIIPKILICIDGLDELRPYDFWIEKLRETSAISSKYPRIKFCASSRPCTFEELARGDELLKNKVQLKSYGDVPVNELFENYKKKYNISVIGSNWLRWALKTPLALKLFCEIYVGQTISNISKSSMTISKLIEQKIYVMDFEFRKFCGKYSEKDYILWHSVLIIGSYFSTNRKILKNNLLQLLKDSPNLKIVNEGDHTRIIEYLEIYGFIQSYKYEQEGLLSVPQIYYETGIQPFFDYILAILLLENNPDPYSIESLGSILYNTGALQMASILLLEEHKVLISDIECFNRELYAQDLFEFDCFALTNVPPELITNYVPNIEKFMMQNASSLMETVNNIILPVARIQNHPLGAKFLHEYLISFKKPADRDLHWSIQMWLSGDGDEIWACNTSLDIDSNQYQLTEEDVFDGLPLIYAWLLTNIDNKKRALYRKELMKWALMHPKEYCKLFDLVFKTNDPQMKEDLLGIAMGLAYSVAFEDESLKFFTDFVLTEIFESEKIKIINNIVIRHYSRAIAERAYQAGLIEKEQLKLCIPPYKTNIDTIPMAKEATSGNRMGGYGPIDYDLSRYVLCDSIARIFFDKPYDDSEREEPIYAYYFKVKEIEEILKTNAELKEEYKDQLIDAKKYMEKRELLWQRPIDFKIIEDIDFDDESKEFNIESPKEPSIKDQDFYSHYNNKAKEFLKEKAKELEMDLLNPAQFVLASAFAYIKNMGWNEAEFDGDNGVDRAILKSHRPATHGSKSDIMTFCEKYIWCFKNEIYGYLMDRLPPRNDYSNIIDSINDYSLIKSNIINPAQELYQCDHREKMKETEWYTPEQLSPTIAGLKNTKEDIIHWINNAPIPDFSKWINIVTYNELKDYDNNWVALYNFNCIKEMNVGAESLLWTSSGIISKCDFPHLIKDLSLKRHYICQKFSNPEDFHSSPITDCYITPKEICQMDWKQEASGFVEYYTVKDAQIESYKIIKTVGDGVADYDDHGEIYYKFPSKDIRQLLNIKDGDGTFYYHQNGKVEAIYLRAGENWAEQQNFLCVNKDKLIQKLDENGQRIFWICRLLREPAHESYEKHKDFYVRNDKTWLVWFEDNGECRSFCFNDSFQ